MHSPVVCFAILLMATVSGLATTESDDMKWETYKLAFGKQYSMEEDEIRKGAFLSADKYIEEQNKLGHSWMLGHNENSDMVDDEVSPKSYHQLVDLLPSRIETGYNQNAPVVIPPLIVNPPQFHENPLPLPPAVFTTPNVTTDISAEVDYREDSCMPPVKYHANSHCIADWAFAAVTPIEFNLCKRTGFKYDLSEQQLLDCEFNGHGCSGGRFMFAWLYLLSKGSALENYYPFMQSGAYVCKSVPFYGIGAHITRYAYVNGDSNATEQALVEHGPLATEIFAPVSFIYYRSGLYDDSLCGTSNMHVALVIVGYGTNEEGTPYWIVRNSWGTSWGQNGYMTIRRGVNLCGIEYYAAYVKLA